MEVRKKSGDFYSDCIVFFLFCIVGWLYEVALGFLYGHGFVNRGFLFGPYLPVYGFGALLLIKTLAKVMANKKYIGKVPVTPVIVFFYVVVITTVVEYITSYVMELIFHRRWWDYSEDFLNINGRVCPRTSFRFGLGGLLFLYVLAPLFYKVIDTYFPKSKKWIAAGITVLVCIDCVATLFFLI